MKKTREYKNVCSKERAFDNSFIFKDITDISQIESLKLGDSIRLADKRCNVIKNPQEKMEICINYRYGNGPKQYSKRHLTIEKLKYLYECYTNSFDIDNDSIGTICYKSTLSYDEYMNDDMKYEYFDLERIKVISKDKIMKLYNQYFTVLYHPIDNILSIIIPYLDENGIKRQKRHSLDRIIYDYYKYMYYKYVKNV